MQLWPNSGQYSPAGVVGGIAALVLVLGVAAFFFLRGRRAQAGGKAYSDAENAPPSSQAANSSGGEPCTCSVMLTPAFLLWSAHPAGKVSHCYEHQQHIVLRQHFHCTEISTLTRML